MNATRNSGMRCVGLLLASACMLGIIGCAAEEPVLEDQAVAELSTLRYPGQSAYGPDLDIVITRDGSDIRLINRTARSYEGLQLWLNQQYVQDAQQIAIGENPQLQLPTFINRHGEPFPTARFLQPERARPVISAELYDPKAQVRYRLTVQPDNATLRL